MNMRDKAEIKRELELQTKKLRTGNLNGTEQIRTDGYILALKWVLNLGVTL